MALKVFLLTVAVFSVGQSYGQIYTSSDMTKPASSIESAENVFTTQTVYGFLDFTTTIGHTVMVFSPQSAPEDGYKNPEISVEPIIKTSPANAPKKNLDISPSKTQSGATENRPKGTKIIVNSSSKHAESVHSEDASVKPQHATATNSRISMTVSSKDEVSTLANNFAEPEYDFLSKQPSEVVDETYKLINLKPSSKVRPTPRRDKENPTGLVTKLGGTIVKDGFTTVHETSVIGTYISGKYAQVLQSSSRVLKNEEQESLEDRIRPTNSQKILKTIGPHHGKIRQQLEATPAVQQDEPESDGSNGARPNRRLPSNPQSRLKFRNKIEDSDGSEYNSSTRPNGKPRATTARPSYKNRLPPTSTTESSTTRRRPGFRPSQSSVSSKIPKANKNEQPSFTLPAPKLKLPRTQGRWSYKTTPKPRISIRKQAEEEARPLPFITNTVSSSGQVISESTSSSPVSGPEDVPSSNPKSPNQEVMFEGELDESESNDFVNISVPELPTFTEQILPVETLNIEISTPADFNDIYFEIATIKSPYTFQVGTLRNTRYVTVTSTQKKSFATAEPFTSVSPTEPLTENILANTAAAYDSTLPLDSSIATLPAISLEPGQATPPLETITETFSTTQTLLKTHLLPVIANGNTTRITLVQTYNIARLVTATKTLPPMEIYQFIPSKTLNEFNSKLDEAGSELHLELDFGDEEDEREDEDIPKRVAVPNADADAELDQAFRSATPSKPKIEVPNTSSVQDPRVEQQRVQPVNFFGQAQVITSSKPIVVLETLYESHVIPVVNNGNTFLSTLSRIVGTVPKTSYEIVTSTIATPQIQQLQQVPQVPQVPQLPQVPYYPQQQQFTLTSAPIVTHTLATISDSRILKLTFGAKTAYTTLYSTKVVPTEFTTYITSTIPFQHTVPSYPGFFPPPIGYPAYPYVG